LSPIYVVGQKTQAVLHLPPSEISILLILQV
jgi:hypothetical protein